MESRCFRLIVQNAVFGFMLSLIVGDAFGFEPSPLDTTKIAFVSTRDSVGPEEDSNPEIYVMNSDGSDITRLTHDPGVDVYPAWSPDGTNIAFSYRRGADVPRIYILFPNGRTARLTDAPCCTAHGDEAPAWSPDGTKIAFQSGLGDDGGRDIFCDECRWKQYYPTDEKRQNQLFSLGGKSLTQC